MEIYLPPLCRSHPGLTKIKNGKIANTRHPHLLRYVEAYRVFDRMEKDYCTLIVKNVLDNLPNSDNPQLLIFKDGDKTFTIRFIRRLEDKKDVYHTDVRIALEETDYGCCGCYPGGYETVILHQKSEDYLS